MCYHIVLEGTNKCPGEYYTQAELHKLLKYKYLVVTELHTHIGTEGNYSADKDTCCPANVVFIAVALAKHYQRIIHRLILYPILRGVWACG